MVDLHTHSFYSDGTASPAALIEEAERLELAAIALSDHNTAQGLPEFMAAAQGKRVIAVPSAELAGLFRGQAVHIHALFLPATQYAAVDAFCADFCKQDTAFFMDAIRRLQKDGYALNEEQLLSTVKTQLSPAHICRSLWHQGFAASYSEAAALFKQYYTDPLLAPPAAEVVEFIRSIGALPVAAHPLQSLKEEAVLCAFLEEMIPLGLVGMETQYSAYNEKTAAKAAEIAQKYHLFPSGGSDFHGENRPAIRIGIGKGNMAVPDSFYEALRALAGSF